MCVLYASVVSVCVCVYVAVNVRTVCVCVCVSSDTPVSELSLELLLLQVVLPALLEQGHTRQWLKALIRAWCVAAAWLLNLRSYLLGDVPLDEVSAVYM